MHNGSFPAANAENTGFGTINSNGGKILSTMLQDYLTQFKWDRQGKTKSSDSSPILRYNFSNNPLFIDLRKIDDNFQKWHKISSRRDF